MFAKSQVSVPDKLIHYARLVRADKPIGSLLLMWPMLWVLWVVADGFPRLDVLLVFLAGAFLMRSAGCAINDYADRDIDGAVKRTRDRPLAAGLISPTEALLVMAVLSLAAFMLVLTMNRLTILMSFAGLGLAILYPFTKRLTHWPQLFLGLASGWAVPMASAAQVGTVTPVAWLVFVAAIIWALGYDTIYAMVDRDDDIKIGVKSTAIYFGRHDLLAVGIIQSSMLACMLLLGAIEQYGLWFYLGWLVAAIVVAWQMFLIRHRERAACFRAFLLNNYVGFALFAGIFLQLFRA